MKIIKSLFFCCSLLSFLACSAQNFPQPIGAPGRTVKTLGFHEVDSGFVLPAIKPLSTKWKIGQLFYQTSDSSLYTYTGFQWLKQGGSGGGLTNLGVSYDDNQTLRITNSNGTEFIFPNADGNVTGLVPPSKWQQWDAKIGPGQFKLQETGSATQIKLELQSLSGIPLGAAAFFTPVNTVAAGIVTPTLFNAWNNKIS
jgi:hypothetical protein